MHILLWLFACSSGSMDLTLTHVGPEPSPGARVLLTPTSATLKHVQPVQLLFSGSAENPTVGAATLPVSLSARVVQIGEIPVPLEPTGAVPYDVPLELDAGTPIVSEAILEVPLDVALGVPAQRELRARCAEGTASFQLLAKWETSGLRSAPSGWTVQRGDGVIAPLLDPLPTTVECALPAPASEESPVPIYRATSATQARQIGRFSGPHFETGGPVVATKLRAAGLEAPGGSWGSTGESRTECGEMLAKADGGAGTPLLVGGDHALQPREVKRLAELPEPRPVEGVDTVTVTGAWVVDLDGDGTEETVLVAQTEMGEPDDLDHAFVEVRTADTLDRVGFPGGAVPGVDRTQDASEAHIVELDAIADVNGDGRMELVVSHHQPWSHFHEQVVYAWSPAGFWALATDVRAERDCYASDDWKRP